MHGPVVVGVDGSTASAKAISLAVDAAKRRGVGVKLVHAYQVPVMATPFAIGVMDQPMDAYREFAEQLLESARKQAHACGHEVPIETVYASGPPAAVLLEASKDASLVILGNRGLGAMGNVFLGSVSTRVASRASCPVIVTSDGSRAADNHGPIVVGVDGSEHADGALRYALDTGVRLGTAVEVVAAWDVPPVSEPVSAKVVQELHDSAEEEAGEAIRVALERVRTDQHSDLEVTPITAKGSPARVLLEAGRDARLIVIGSRGRGEIRGALLGSVSRTLLKESDQPVVVIHAADPTAEVC